MSNRAIDPQISAAASALARLGAGKPKRFTPQDIARRVELLKTARAKLAEQRKARKAS